MDSLQGSTPHQLSEAEQEQALLSLEEGCEPIPLEEIIVPPDGGPAELVLVRRQDPVKIFTDHAFIKLLLERIGERARDFEADLTTRKGREKIASQAYRVAQTKTYLDNLGKQAVADLKDLPRQVDAGRKLLRDGLDNLRDDVRKNLTEWEAKIQALKNRIQGIRNMPTNLAEASALVIEAAISEVGAINPSPEIWEELASEAGATILEVQATLEEMLVKRRAYEADQAELERLRKEKAERDRLEAETKAEEDRKAREEELRLEGEARAKERATAAAPSAAQEPMGFELAQAIPAECTGADPGISVGEFESVKAEAPAEVPGSPAPPALAASTTSGARVEAQADIQAVIETLWPGWRDAPEFAEAILTAIRGGKVRHVSTTC